MLLLAVCRCKTREACPGNSSNSCARGYTSHLCGKCVANWGSPRPFVCRECWGSGMIITLYILAALAMLFYAKVLCHLTLSVKTTPAGLGPVAILPPGQPASVELPAQPGHQKQAPVNATAAVCATDIAHVFMFYLQCMWILSTLDVQYPTSLSAPFHALRWLFSTSSPRALGIDCVLRDRGHMTVAAQEFVLSMFMPLVIMLVLLAYEALVACIKLAQHRCARAAGREQLHKLTATGIILLTAFLPQLLRAVFGLFACVPLDNPVSPPYEAQAVGSFWVSDMSQQCWQGYHKALALGAGIPFILLLCVVWPGSVLVFMLRRRDGSLYSRELRHYSFLFDMYKPSAAWWEVVIIMELSVLVAIAVFAVKLGTYLGCVTLLAAFILVAWLLVWIRPYKSAATGTVASRGALCVLLTSFSTLLFMPVGTLVGRTHAYEQYAVAVGVVVICINIAFVVSVIWKVVRVVEWKALGAKVKGIGDRVFGVHSQALPSASAPRRAGQHVELV